MDEKSCAVYLITKKDDGKQYAGKSVDPNARWKAHRQRARDGDRRHLYAAMRLHGVDAFVFEVVSWWPSEIAAEIEEQRLIKERNLTDQRVGYNLTSGGRQGCAWSEEAKERVRGRPNPWKDRKHSVETKKRISEALSGENNPNFGQTFSKERCERMSSSQKGRTFTDEHCQKLREAKLRPDNPHRGAKRSEKTKQKMRDVWKRRKREHLLPAAE